ncbi:MAG TPA: type III pantothenate kinase [Steroidobacteraceae bacterium]|nr:type III pantothenate kinase [Steroidobacteraceae bacterium]
MSDARARGSTLLVDIGNTRVKWARLVGGRLGRQHAAAHTDWTSDDFARAIFGKRHTGARSKRDVRLDRILVVSVAGPRVERAFAAAARARTGIEPEVFTSRRRAGGVTTHYDEPWRLGADRLVGAIGAHRLAHGRAVCVVAVGTALTLDLVDERGRHRGGAIVPAPHLMKDSLLSKTNGIRRRAQGGSMSSSFFARSTRGAIEQGARYAAAAVIDRAVREARDVIGRAPLVLLTGGGAAALRPLIRSRHTFMPDLVLQGLAVIAEDSAKRS